MYLMIGLVALSFRGDLVLISWSLVTDHRQNYKVTPFLATSFFAPETIILCEKYTNVITYYHEVGPL
jgi:hypothetical protein